MLQVSPTEFQALPLRVHAFLADVPLHDVWAVDLPTHRDDVTLSEFLRRASQSGTNRLPPMARALFRLLATNEPLLPRRLQPPVAARVQKYQMGVGSISVSKTSCSKVSSADMDCADRLRHSKFVALREDKNPRSVIKEEVG